MLRYLSPRMLFWSLTLALLLVGCARGPAEQTSPASAPATTAAAAAPTVAPEAVALAPSDVAPPPATVTPPGGAPAPPTAIPTRTPPPSPAPPTATPLATATVATSQTEGVAVIITSAAVNLRAGPSTDFDVIGQASGGQRYPALARSAAGDWWQVDVGGPAAWVSAELARVEGDPAVLPLAEVAAPPAASSAPVQVYEIELTIPTYPYAAFTTEATNAQYNWSYRRFDAAAYEASNPQPTATAYRGVVLENEYLRLVLLPDLGGRIYQVIFKPTGSNQLYQNPVIKPSPWGPAEQGGWLAVGGIEWGLPVAEHGYAWGDRWGHITTPFGPDAAGVTLFMPYEEHLRAEVDVILRAGEAAFTLRPRIVNPTAQAVSYQFWLDAMLAPGPNNQPGPNLRFILPTSQVTVHSRGDDFLPAAQQAMSWPVYSGVDFSRLGAWNDWLGVFERPAAHGPFAGVYDPDVDEGMVRVFPPAATPGSKIFAMGYAAPIDPGVYTDDRSAYVELHGGVSPTYWDQATLAAGATYTWQETWFPVAGIGGVSYADGSGAVSLARQGDTLAVGLFPVRAVQGRVEVAVDGQTVLDEPATLSPAQPWRRDLALSDIVGKGRVAVRLFDQSGVLVINYEQLP
ncbi:MAG TPA: DUF5107 domain-containing protein [Anaerolineae bacterium]|nr:DUF5107 domain-containing protein [Anaerolineae bacterium]